MWPDPVGNGEIGDIMSKKEMIKVMDTPKGEARYHSASRGNQSAF